MVCLTNVILLVYNYAVDTYKQHERQMKERILNTLTVLNISNKVTADDGSINESGKYLKHQIFGGHVMISTGFDCEIQFYLTKITTQHSRLVNAYSETKHTSLPEMNPEFSKRKVSYSPVQLL